jgi:hypothetical protein
VECSLLDPERVLVADEQGAVFAAQHESKDEQDLIESLELEVLFSMED